MLMLFVARLGIFRIQQKLSKSQSNLIPFKGNNKAKSLSKRVAQVVSCQLFRQQKYFLLTSIFSGKWRYLAWHRKGIKINLHHLRKIYAVFKIAVLTPKSGKSHVIHVIWWISSTRKTCIFPLEGVILLWVNISRFLAIILI